MHHTPEERAKFAKGLGYMVITVLVWAGWAICNRMGFHGHLNTYDIVAARMVVAGVLFIPLLFKYGVKVGPHGYLGALALMIVAGAPYCLVAIGGFSFAPAAHVGIINATIITLTVSVGILVLKERGSKIRWAGLAVVLVGMACIMLSKSPADVADDAWIGHILFIFAGLGWGSYTLLARAWSIKPLHGVAVVSVLSLAAYLPIYILFLPKGIGDASWQEIGWQAFYQGLVTNIIALITYTRAINLIGASSAGAFVPTVPVIAALLAIPILGEVPSHMEWVGILTVVAGVVAASGTLEHVFFKSKQAVV